MEDEMIYELHGKCILQTANSMGVKTIINNNFIRRACVYGWKAEVQGLQQKHINCNYSCHTVHILCMWLVDKLNLLRENDNI
jgi:hypothetical protein